MTATLPTAIDRPIQLTLELRTPSVRVSRAKQARPYWQRVDLADVGAELHAIATGVRALLTADRRVDGLWVGYHDLVLGQGGSSGPTRTQPERNDALVSAAYQLVRHCEEVLAQNGSASRSDATAARQVIRWLRQLDLL